MDSENRNIRVIVGVIIVVLIIILGVFVGTRAGGEDSVVSEFDNDDSVMMTSEDDVMKDGTVMTSDTPSTVMQMTHGSYEDFAFEKVTQSTGKVVLFFHAPWCPICNAIEKDIQNNVAKIPSDVMILKVDFDSQTKLRQEFGVTVQHTFVQVTADGVALQKWSDSADLKSILARLN